MAECKLCAEKQREINRILKAFKKNNKKNTIIISTLGGLLLLVTAFGKEGLTMAIDGVIRFFGK